MIVKVIVIIMNNNKIFKLYTPNIYNIMVDINDYIKQVNNIDKVTIYWYFVIFIGIMYVFTRQEIKLNFILGVGVGLLMIYYLYINYVDIKKNDKNTMSSKRNLIKPIPDMDKAGKHDEIVDYLFSIQDFYEFNPQSHEDLIEHIDYFFTSYNEVKNNNRIAGVNYEIMTDQKRLALNTLKSLVHSMPINTKYDIKLNRSVKVLEYLLNRYLDEVEYIQKVSLHENGYTTYTRIMDYGPVGIDTYNDEYFSFEVF
jgi:hypothetical protein